MMLVTGGLGTIGAHTARALVDLGHEVVEWLEGDAAWEIIDQLSTKYTGAPYPREHERLVVVVEPECREPPAGSAHHMKGLDRRGPRHQETTMPKYLLLEHDRGGPAPHRGGRCSE